MFRKRSDTKAKQNRGRHRCALFHVIWDIFRHFAKEHFFRVLFIASLLWRSKRLGHMMRDETRIMTSHKATLKRMSTLVCSIVRRVDVQSECWRDCWTSASPCSVEHAFAAHGGVALNCSAAQKDKKRRCGKKRDNPGSYTLGTPPRAYPSRGAVRDSWWCIMPTHLCSLAWLHAWGRKASAASLHYRRTLLRHKRACTVDDAHSTVAK